MEETAFTLTKATLALDTLDAIRKDAEAVDELAGSLSAPEAAAALEAGESAARDLADALGSLRRRLRALMDAENLPWVEHGGRRLKRTASRKVTTDWQRLASVLAARTADHAADPASGEVMPIGAICQLVADAFMAVAPLTPSARPRQDALRARGIDPDTYTESEWGDETVRWEA